MEKANSEIQALTDYVNAEIQRIENENKEKCLLFVGSKFNATEDKKRKLFAFEVIAQGS